MNRTRTRHRCQSCGATAARWSGRCGTCGGWNTLVEERVAERAGAPCGPGIPPVPVCEVPEVGVAVRPTGLGEFDRVMGGGLVPGSVTLVGGEPGIGKSTLTLQLLAAVVAGGGRALLVCGEESVAQVRMRAGRLGAVVDGLWLQAETALAQVIVAVEDLRPDVVVVDSIQTMHDDAVDAAPGSVAQVRECAAALVGLAKRTGTAVVLVGHVTKDGAIAGPRVLEHLVDTVCWFEGDRHHALRLLRTVKHRFGSTADLGVFEMRNEGLVAIEDPSALFLGDHRCGVPGAAVVATMEGRRPLLVEVQALVASGETPVPRRSAQGVDHNRLSVLLAVLAERCGLPSLATRDVYASAVGGVRLAEPAGDLGLALAIASALSGVPLPEGMVACGEVGLGGEVRQVAHLQRRLAEAARLGFGIAIVPSSPPGPRGLRLERVTDLRDALVAFGLVDPAGTRRTRARVGARAAAVVGGGR